MLRVEGGADGGRSKKKKTKKGKLNKIAFEQKSHFLSILQPRHNLGHLTTQFPAALSQRGNSSSGLGGCGGAAVILADDTLRRESCQILCLCLTVAPFCQIAKGNM